VSEHVPASFIGPPAPSTAAAPQAPSGPAAQRGQIISPPPPVDPPDNSLYVDHGILWQQYSKGVDEAMNSDNPWWARGILGGLSILAAPIAGAEEYIGRPLANIPWVLENAGTSIGQHIGRAVLWSRQGEGAEATVDSLEAVVAFAGGFDTAASAALPVTALETAAVPKPVSTVTTVSTELEGDAASSGADFMRPGDKFGTYAKNAAPEPGFTDVSIHGNTRTFSVTATSPALSHRTVARLLEASPDYSGGPIRLLSCRTGAAGASAAQNLSNTMGVEVLAPSDTLWAFPSGRFVIGPDEFTNTGVWRLFTPGVKP